MGKKAVYNNQHLAIYITGDDFENLLKQTWILVPVLIGKHPDAIGLLKIEMPECTRDGLALALSAERQIVQEIQDQFAKDHPDYENSTQVQRRQQRDRRKVR